MLIFYFLLLTYLFQFHVVFNFPELSESTIQVIGYFLTFLTAVLGIYANGQQQLKSKSIDAVSHEIERLEDKMLLAQEAIADIHQNVSLDWLAFQLNKTNEHSMTYENSKSTLGAIIRIYAPKYFSLYRKYTESIYNFLLASRNSPNDEKVNPQDDFGPVTNAYSDFFRIQSELQDRLHGQLNESRKDFRKLIKR